MKKNVLQPDSTAGRVIGYKQSMEFLKQERVSTSFPF